MHRLGQLLAAIPLPTPEGPADPMWQASAGQGQNLEGLVHELAADLPAGHLHIWGGPSGAGKTSLLLALLHGAAARGRPVVYATYDLAPESLAVRTLAMLAGVDHTSLPDIGGPVSAGALDGEAVARVLDMRRRLADLPFYLLPARGFGVASLADRLVRAPTRPQVLVVDYVQAIIRPPDTELGSALRELSDLASHQHVSVVCVMRADGSAADEGVRGYEAQQESAPWHGLADRVGWLAPGADSTSRRADIVSNRYGERPSVPLRVDPASGRLRRAQDPSAQPDAGGSAT